MECTIYDTESGTQQTVAFEKQEVLIGSGPACDLILRGSGISERQVRYYIRSHHRYLDVYEGASVWVFYREMESFPPPDNIKGLEVKPGQDHRIDGYSFKIAQYVIRPVKSIHLRPVTVKRMIKRNS